MNGIANIFVQLPDNLLFLYTYLALTTVNRSRKCMRPLDAAATALYISLVLFVPFFAPNTFVPLIVNENTDDYNTRIGLPLLQGYTYGYVLYNLYFTLIFMRVLFSSYFDRKAFYPPIARDICFRCILHFFIRCGPTRYCLLLLSITI